MEKITNKEKSQKNKNSIFPLLQIEPADLEKLSIEELREILHKSRKQILDKGKEYIYNSWIYRGEPEIEKVSKARKSFKFDQWVMKWEELHRAMENYYKMIEEYSKSGKIYDADTGMEVKFVEMPGFTPLILDVLKLWREKKITETVLEKMKNFDEFLEYTRSLEEQIPSFIAQVKEKLSPEQKKQLQLRAKQLEKQLSQILQQVNGETSSFLSKVEEIDEEYQEKIRQLNKKLEDVKEILRWGRDAVEPQKSNVSLEIKNTVKAFFDPLSSADKPIPVEREKEANRWYVSNKEKYAYGAKQQIDQFWEEWRKKSSKDRDELLNLLVDIKDRAQITPAEAEKLDSLTETLLLSIYKKLSEIEQIQKETRFREYLRRLKQNTKDSFEKELIDFILLFPVEEAQKFLVFYRENKKQILQQMRKLPFEADKDLRKAIDQEHEELFNQFEGILQQAEPLQEEYEKIVSLLTLIETAEEAEKLIKQGKSITEQHRALLEIYKTLFDTFSELAGEARELITSRIKVREDLPFFERYLPAELEDKLVVMASEILTIFHTLEKASQKAGKKPYKRFYNESGKERPEVENTLPEELVEGFVLHAQGEISFEELQERINQYMEKEIVRGEEIFPQILNKSGWDVRGMIGDTTRRFFYALDGIMGPFRFVDGKFVNEKDRKYRDRIGEYVKYLFTKAYALSMLSEFVYKLMSMSGRIKPIKEIAERLVEADLKIFGLTMEVSIDMYKMYKWREKFAETAERPKVKTIFSLFPEPMPLEVFKPVVMNDYLRAEYDNYILVKTDNPKRKIKVRRGGLGK